MDGIHDMGGRHGYGPVKVTTAEPPFPEEWQGRMFGIVRAIKRPPSWNIDKFRYTREQIPPIEYLTRTYFDQWYMSYAAMLLGSGVVTLQELATGRSAAAGPDLGQPMTAPEVAKARTVAARFDRPYDRAPAFSVGARVRARADAPVTHTRLPGYARGRPGTVIAHHGAHVLPDASAIGPEVASPLYAVAFRIGDLFAEQKDSPDMVNLDLWEAHLEPASG